MFVMGSLVNASGRHMSFVFSGLRTGNINVTTLRLCTNGARRIRSTPNVATNSCCSKYTKPSLLQNSVHLGSHNFTQARYANFFNKHTADHLWKSVTSVSKQGAQKGRGKGRKRIKNLNRGQVIGKGSINMVWPGLNAPLMRNMEVNRQQLLEPDPSRQEELYKLRDSMTSKRYATVHPLERGWSSTKWGGRKMGAPDPVGEETFKGFESICLEFKIVNVMTGLHGRKRSFSAFCVTGNYNGLAGFGLGKASTGPSALKTAKNKAAQQLLYIERYQDHTILHDFFTEFGNTRIYVKKMHKGFGLVCHRAIREICKVFGITDIYAKLEGAINVQNITKAFFLGLLNQKSYQQLANDKQLHYVEFREENLNYPTVLASPEGPVRTLSEISPTENLDVTIHCMDGKVQLERKKYPPSFMSTRGYEKHLKSYQYRRNDLKTKRELYKEYGDLKSFFTEQYPECYTHFWHHVKTQEAEENSF